VTFLVGFAAQATSFTWKNWPVATSLNTAYALQKYDFIEVVPVNPSTLAWYRKLLHPSGAKDDPTDAEIMLDLVLKHPDRHRLLQSHSAVGTARLTR
jgi:hypothetical protein